MNRLLRLLLLVSVGLNVGLGWALLRDRSGGFDGRDGHPRTAAGRAWRERPAPDDTAAWRRVMDRRIERLSGRLDLDPDQAERLHRLQLGNGPLMHAARQRVESGREAVRAAVGADGFGDGQVRQALRELRRAQADLDSLAQEFLMQEFAVLTPEQREHYARILPLDPWGAPRANRPHGPGEGSRRGEGRRPAPE